MGDRRGDRTQSVEIVVVLVITILAVAGGFGWVLAEVLGPSFGIVIVGVALVVAAMVGLLVLATTPYGP